MDGQGELLVGLMSGTSVDAIDAALVRCSTQGLALETTYQHRIDDDTKREIAALCLPGENEIERLGRLDRELGLLFAAAAQGLLNNAGVPASAVTAIGSHGQTIRHRPPSTAPRDGYGFTLQIGDPNTIAEVTGVTTVADFRRRDIAAGGEGAPLVPAFHAAAFAATGTTRAIVNIGGIANVTLLDGQQLIAGFDTGPGNTLMDHWTRLHRSGDYDRGGRWAATGKVIPPLLDKLLSHSYFRLSGPRSTGREVFSMPWLEQQVHDIANFEPADVQATLLEFTCRTIADAISRSGFNAQQVFLCGGGAHNDALVRRLGDHMAPATLRTTSDLGIDPDWVEATAFAWLAWKTLRGEAGNAPQVTGACGPRVLGTIYPAAKP